MSYARTYRRILTTIESFDVIAVFRHEAPDFDALGSQFGLVSWLKENFPSKTIYALSDEKEPDTIRGIFPLPDPITDDVLFAKPFLSIVVDTSDTKRICDKRALKGEKIIKIDHHVSGGDDYGQINFVPTDFVAASEILTDMISSRTFKGYKIGKETARYFYIGIAGDSGRFQYTNTSARTLRHGATLIEAGQLDLQKEVYLPMYLKNVASLRITAYILSNFKVSEHGVGYYILNQSDLNALGLDANGGSGQVNLLANIEEIKVWVSFTEDIEKGYYRVSFRSRELPINEVALKYNGGGHKHAAGARAENLEVIQTIIADIDQRLAAQ